MSSSQTNPEVLDMIEELYRDYYHEAIGTLAQKYPTEQRTLELDWMDVYRFDPDLADDLRDHPDQFLDYFEEALRLYDLPVDISLADAQVLVTNLPESREHSVGGTRADHLEKMVAITGQVSKRSDIKPKLESGAFECQRCGTITNIPQRGGDLQEPHECQGCERQGPFRIKFDQSEKVDQQTIRIQEPPEESTGGRSSTLDASLEGDLVGSVEAGDRVTVSGILKPEPDVQEVTFDTFLASRGTEIEETDFQEINVDEYEDEILALADDDPIQQIIDSIAPGLKGMDTIKEALALQLFGGVRSRMPDDSTVRGDFHMLLLGDPGCGKSSLLRAMHNLAPRSIYTSGKGTSAAGMTGAAVRDDFGDTEWSIEAGALVEAHQGIACVDEIDKVDEDARSSLHNALESQVVELSKAGINTSMPAQTSLLAAGNPKYGRFDPYEPAAEQIDLGPTLLSRFDLWFMLSDEPDKQEDEEVARHMVASRRKATEFTHGDGDCDTSDIEPAISQELLRAYIAYAKQRVFPTIPDSNADRIVQWYTELRQANADNPDGPVPVTARKVEAIERLAEASARARLSQTVESEDIERAGRLVMQSMRDVGVDPETGELDADVIEAGTSKSQRDRIKTVKGIIDDLATEHDQGAPKEVVLDEAMDCDLGLNQTEHDLEKLKEKGEVYEPREDHFRTS
jgi:replicative DNA helicase Mcm